MINLQSSFFTSDQTNYREISTQTESVSIAPANTSRRGGLIVNLSDNDLYVWFGSILPPDVNRWLIIPSKANCDIPLFFVGNIQGVWFSDDNKSAKIYEFYK